MTEAFGFLLHVRVCCPAPVGVHEHLGEAVLPQDVGHLVPEARPSSRLGVGVVLQDEQTCPDGHEGC